MRAEVVGIHPNHELYGSDRVFLSGMEALAGQGPSLAVLPDEGQLGPELRTVGVAVDAFDFPVLRKVNLRGLKFVGFLAQLVVALPRLVMYLRAHSLGTVYVSTIICPIWILAGRLAGRAVVCHVHENEPGMSPIKRRVLLSPLLLCDRVIANSASTREWVSQDFRSLRDRVSVVYNGVEPPAPGVAELGHAAHHLLVVGRLSERKGQDIAVAALGLLRDRGFDVDLTLVGDVYEGYEQFKETLTEQIARLGLVDRVQFAGFQTDVGGYYDGADVVLVPSRMEPFGNVAVEGQLSGRVVVASNVQGLAEIVNDDVTGFLVPPFDPEALSEAIARVLQDPVTADRIGKAGEAAARLRFGVEAYADRFVRSLE